MFLLAALTAALVCRRAVEALATGKPWLWQCTQIHNSRGAVPLLRAAAARGHRCVGKSGRASCRGSIAGSSRSAGRWRRGCHVLMHQVGREFGASTSVTLATLQRYVPRSNNPNCSAGFGMGLVMYLGPQILRSGGRPACARAAQLPTRYRSYTCVHGLGHALMRAYHGDIGQAVRACRKLARAYAPDCAQGVFHDYWISLRGADGTTRPQAVRSRRACCATGASPTSGRAGTATSSSSRLCSRCATPPICAARAAGWHGLERFGCISAAALTISSNPFDQMRSLRAHARGGCGRLPARRSGSGARGRSPRRSCG